MKKTSNQLSSLTIAVLSALSLAGCSGGGGGSSAPTQEPVVVQSDVASSCTDCAAVDGNTYSGAGVGVWHKTNTGATDQM